MTDARIEETAKLIRDNPGLEVATINHLNLEWPRLRCFFFFQDEDPTKPDHSRAQIWRLAGLQESFYDMDKEYARAASEMAIPQLLMEINVTKEPRMAERRFRFMVSDPDLSWAFLLIAEHYDEEPMQQYLERILQAGDEENGGFGS